MNGLVFNIQRFCSNDGPGIRTAVFFKGCPLDCCWCHNPESKSRKTQLSYDDSRCVGCGQCQGACRLQCHSMESGKHRFSREKCMGCGACAEICPGALTLVGSEVSVGEVMSVVLRDSLFYGENGGLTVSGGEPFAQVKFLFELLKDCRRNGVRTCVETSGYAPIEDIRASLPLVDTYLFDIKETDPELHRRWTGVDNALILQNFEELCGSGADIVMRCPLIPGCNDRESHLQAVGELSKRFRNVRLIEVMAYHPLGAKKAENVGVPYRYASVDFPDVTQVEEWMDRIGTVAACEVRRG